MLFFHPNLAHVYVFLRNKLFNTTWRNNYDYVFEFVASLHNIMHGKALNTNAVINAMLSSTVIHDLKNDVKQRETDTHIPQYD